jgi:glutamate racemase
MEPAVKPAAETSQSRRVGVLATPATFQGALYASVVERFGQDVRLLQHTCPGLVGQIEAGRLDTPKTRRILEDALLPMLAEGIDTVVLGCTHYPFVIPLIEQIVGPGVRVIDPAPAVARQVGRMLDVNGLRQVPVAGEQASGDLRFMTTGEALRLEAHLPRLLGEIVQVEKLRWKSGILR